MRRLSCFVVLLVLMSFLSSAIAAPGAENNTPTAPRSDAPIENVFNDNSHRGAGNHELDEVLVLLIRDAQTWWGPCNTEILDFYEAEGFLEYDILSSTEFDEVDLSQYFAIFVEGCQDAPFNANVVDRMDVLEEYVDDGGWLQYHGGTNDHGNQWILFDGTTYTTVGNSNQNYIADGQEEHPVLVDLVEPFQGNSCNHGTLNVMPDNAIVLVENAEVGGEPTLIEYDYGRGHVIVSTMTMEYIEQHGNEGGSMELPWRLFEYTLTHPSYGALFGNVTDEALNPLENVEVQAWLQDDELVYMGNAFTDANGDYAFEIEDQIVVEGFYDITAFLPGYQMGTEADVEIISDDSSYVDFALAEETNEVLIVGVVRSAEDPEELLQDVIVSIPALGIWDDTNFNGIFNLDWQFEGNYHFEIGHNPTGSEGYHNLELFNVPVNPGTIPLQFELFEIMPPANVTANSGDAEITLRWGLPANHPVDMTLAAVDEDIELYEATIARFNDNGQPDEIAKIPYLEQELSRLNALRKTIIHDGELDEITDFEGYRIRRFYPDDTEELLEDLFTGGEYLFDNLTNDEIYGFSIAAEYGYGEEYLVFSDTLYVRPHTLGGYNFEEVAYEWIEINPDNGGPGTVILDAGDDANSGLWTIAPLNFTYFGNMFNQLAACSNGWMSFTYTGNNIGPTIPDVWEPNNTIIGVNADTDCELGGDELAIWYYVDEDENRVVVQWFVAPYTGNIDYRFSYQAVLDCNDNSIQLNYEWADDWMDINRGGAIIGIENGDGDIAYTYDMNNLVDEMSLKWTPAQWTWGSISGTVTSDLTGDPIPGADITIYDVNGDDWIGITEGDGTYEVLCDLDFGPFSVSAYSPGYYTETIEDVVYDGENNPVVDIELDGVPIGYWDDFEEDLGIWVLSDNNIPGDLEWGIPTAGPGEDHTDEGENCWATVLGGNHTGPMNYGDPRGDTLMTTESWYVGSEDAIVTYWHWIEYYMDAWTIFGAYNFQISTDYGETWEILEPIGGYTGSCNYLGTYNPDNWTWTPEDGFSGSSNAWVQVAFPLGDYLGEDVMFMFHCGNYYGTWNFRYGVAIDDMNIHGVPVPGIIEGIVTDDDTGDPIENAELTLKLEGEEVDFSTTDETGYYFFERVVPTDFNPEDYTIDAVAAFYVEQTLEDIYVPEGETVTVDVSMIPQTLEAEFEGTLWSSDTPDTPVPDATVTIPQLGIMTTTDVNGYFNLGTQIVGTYTFDISYDNPQPNHFATFLNVFCREETMPLELYVSDLMPPLALAADIGDLQVELSWDPPANHEGMDLLAVEDRIEGLIPAVEALRNSPSQRLQAIYRHYESRLFSLQNLRDRLIHAQETNTELDELFDFVGYRLRIDGAIQPEIIEEESIMITGLDNGHEYSFAVAADYGYGDDYLLFTDEVHGRPLPNPGYVFQVIPYNWTEIDPEEGGDGEIFHDADQPWPNITCSEMMSIDPLSFEFYDVEYNEFCAASKGWISFLTTGDFWWIDLPAIWNPNALIVPFNADWRINTEDDGYALYYLVDEVNNEVVIQWKVNNWEMSEFEYQVILDCENNTILWNFDYNDDWDWNHYGPSGVENEDGTIASIYPWEEIGDETSILVRYVAEFGNVVGTVTNEDDEPVEGAYVYLSEDPSAFGVSDENGYYEILLVNIEDEPYTVICHADGYEHIEVDNVNWDNEEFEQVVDFEVIEISHRTPPYFISYDEAFDDRVRLVMGEPGQYQHLVAAQYDDGVAADAWVLPTDSDQNLWAFPFEISGEAQIVQAELRLAYSDSPWGEWPDAQADQVIVQVFNDNNGLPGEVIYSSEAVIAEDGLILLNEAVDVEGRFWVGYYSSTGQEAICVDDQADHGSLLYYSIDGGATWQGLDADGDPLVRLELLSSRPVVLTTEFAVIEPGDADPQQQMIYPVAVSHVSPVYGYVQTIAAPMIPLQPGWSGIDELDEFIGFNIHYSLDDGVTWEQDNVDPVGEDTYDLILGSELEDADILVYLTATVDSAGTEIISDPSEQETMAYNMAPAAPGDITITNINHTLETATITWEVPTENADGTPLVDLVSYMLYRDGDLLETIPFDEEPLQYDDQVPQAGYYTYTVEALDEVPNHSAGTSTEATRIGEPPFWSSFEPDMVPEQPNPFEAQDISWEWGEPGLGPQGGYDDTDNCWATVLDANYLTDQEDWLISTHAWDVIGQLRIIYYHWYDFDWDSGYNLQVSTDNMDTWNVVTPEGGYTNNNVWALQQPGFHLSAQNWQQVEYDLSEFNDADSIHIAFRFASSPWGGNNYYGVAIDNLEIWGVPREARGWVEGFVMDAHDQPMQGARIYAEDLPIFEAFTNAQGYYMLMNVPAGEHDIICEYPFYWPVEVEEFEVIEDDTLTLDFTNDSGMPMLFPDGELETTALQVTVNIHPEDGDSIGTQAFEFESIGTGPLDWSAYIRVINNPQLASVPGGNHGISPDAVFSGPRNNRNGRQVRKTLGLNGPTLTDPNPRNVGPVVTDELDDIWDVIISYDVSTPSDNSGIMAAVTTEDSIYVSASYLDEENGANYLYTFNHQGFLFSSYEYPAEMLDAEGRGFSDLAYSPFTHELFGANADGEVYRFAPDLSEYSLVTTVNFWPNAIAYDWDADLLYLREWGNDFAAVDPISGNITDLDVDPEYRSVSGMAYMPRDDEGYTLWLLYQDGDGLGGYAYRYDPSNLAYDMTSTEIYSPDGNSSAGGMDINLGWRSDFYDITTINQAANDYVDIWEGIISPPEWVWLEPSEGVLDPEELVNLNVQVDIRDKEEFIDVEPGTEIYAEVVFGGPYWANTPVMDLTILIVSEEDAVGEGELMPTRYALHQNYPNPFNPMTMIKFDLVAAQNVKLSVFNVLGQEVARIADHRYEAGFHNVMFKADDLASGMYFYRIETSAFTSMKKMILIK